MATDGTISGGQAASLGIVALSSGRPGRRIPLRRDAHRHLTRRGLAMPVRRDIRRFSEIGVGLTPAIAAPRISDSTRLFAHTFGAAFLFVTVFLA